MIQVLVLIAIGGLYHLYTIIRVSKKNPDGPAKVSTVETQLSRKEVCDKIVANELKKGNAVTSRRNSSGKLTGSRTQIETDDEIIIVYDGGNKHSQNKPEDFDNG